MRIGLLIYGDLDSISGGYLYNRQLVAYLRRRGDDVVVISWPVRPLWQQLGDNFRQDCLRQLTDAKLDVLIQDGMVQPSVFLLNRRLRLRVVTLLHLLATYDQQPRFRAWFYRAIERLYLRSVTGIIANSQTTLAQVSHILDKPLPAHCVAVPAGNHFPQASPDIHAINLRALATGPLNILVVGNVIRRKGLHVLLAALSQLPEETLHVTVVGRLDMEPDYVRQIQHQIHTAGLHTRVCLKGPVQGQALVALYQQHHLMVLPSAYESYGIVYVEAQQFGLPVIGTTGGAAKEIIAQGDNGYLIAPEDSRRLAEILQNLHHDRASLVQLSQRALAAYARHPSWEESCARIWDYCHQWAV
ncbi:MAG: glycosyltransferase family 4 protein [Methylococcales bacterium]|nr:glycosyltransferase family 4 protein [Methylococcales bacterium]